SRKSVAWFTTLPWICFRLRGGAQRIHRATLREICRGILFPERNGRSDRKGLCRIAACLDGLENGSHVSVTETERARFAIERMANIEQWRGDACLASRFGDEAVVLQDVRDRCLDREIAADELGCLYARDVTCHLSGV